MRGTFIVCRATVGSCGPRHNSTRAARFPVEFASMMCSRLRHSPQNAQETKETTKSTKGTKWSLLQNSDLHLAGHGFPPGNAGVPPASFSCKQPPILGHSLARRVKAAYTGFLSNAPGPCAGGTPALPGGTTLPGKKSRILTNFAKGSMSFVISSFADPRVPFVPSLLQNSAGKGFTDRVSGERIRGAGRLCSEMTTRGTKTGSGKTGAFFCAFCAFCG